MLHGKQDPRVADLARPQPVPGAVVMALRRAGICGSEASHDQTLLGRNLTWNNTPFDVQRAAEVQAILAQVLEKG